MEIKRCIIKSFSVIGKEGSTHDGDNFIVELWETSNKDLHEIEPLAKKENGEFVGVWGLMSDFSRKFFPWENNYSQGLYLAGVEVIDGAIAPKGWVKWTVPSMEYVYFSAGNDYKDAFIKGLTYLNNNKLDLVAAVQEFYCPVEKQLYLFFPIRRMDK